MKSYIYVCAWQKELGDLSFTHVFVQAHDEQAAYSLGFKADIMPFVGAYRMNDYVVELPTTSEIDEFGEQAAPIVTPSQRAMLDEMLQAKRLKGDTK